MAKRKLAQDAKQSKIGANNRAFCCDSFLLFFRVFA